MNKKERRSRVKKVLIIFGTRPEAIKCAPVILEMRAQRRCFKTIVCVTAQHREMLDHVLDLFRIRADYDLHLMRRNQTLEWLTARLLVSLHRVLASVKPDLILVQGDTTTTFAASLAAYYGRIPIGHIEAGLRTYDKYSPFPEEINRKITTGLADIHFAPTNVSRGNLLREGVPARRITVTGNTSIDALLIAARMPESARFRSIIDRCDPRRRLIVVTGHRRESFGVPLRNIFSAIKRIVEKNEDVEVVYPVHMNPNVHDTARHLLGNTPRIHLIEPVDYGVMVHLMKRCYLIMTDSGGIQEEAPSLHKPVIILRDVTERPEVLSVGAGILAGTSAASIVRKTQAVLDNKGGIYRRMSRAKNPYGDGRAARRIVRALLSWRTL
ncbi:MAG: UDP-N-acetylglucosamine 2-epimerase (non-hydrolyzing) [Candidatus Aureabacteria bacterium]|nr:UDP-N-acetylglucosamine 2-epimerase (non-hydrolyzing) [Candidatus Auribacterota bacterium]